MRLSLNTLCCQINLLRSQVEDAGMFDLEEIQESIDSLDDSVLAIQTDISNIQAIFNTESIVGAGTAYTLTGTAAAVDLGTTDPVIVLGEAGTYLVWGMAQLEYSGATVVAETATVKLRRTNNTPADIGEATVIDLPVATTLTHTYGIVPLAPVLVTTTNTDDAITIFGNVSVALGAGSIKVSAANIMALRIA